MYIIYLLQFTIIIIIIMIIIIVIRLATPGASARSPSSSTTSRRSSSSPRPINNIMSTIANHMKNDMSPINRKIIIYTNIQ